jgi:hypothetical protein
MDVMRAFCGWEVVVVAVYVILATCSESGNNDHEVRRAD